MRLRFFLIIFFGLILFSGFYGFSNAQKKAEYGDIIINSKAEDMRAAGVLDVLFPHWFHRIRFKCKVCHEDIFILRAGANDIDMNTIINGEFCGQCHNGMVAWEPLYCERCHMWEPGWLPGPIQLSKKVPEKVFKKSVKKSKAMQAAMIKALVEKAKEEEE